MKHYIFELLALSLIYLIYMWVCSLMSFEKAVLMMLSMIMSYLVVELNDPS